MPRESLNRRQFLGSSATNAAGVAAGMLGMGLVAKAAASERVRVAGIGLRNQGKEVITGLAGLEDVDVVTLCDVDESQFAPAARAVEQHQTQAPRFERDFRKVLEDPQVDAIVIATPDHWHALMTILACQAGKDVYVEKPVSHNVSEGEAMVAAARRHARVVQSGIQQRSGSHFQSAIAFVQSGQLGAVHLAKAWTVHVRKSIGHKADGPPPAGVDYDLWLGPAKAREFNSNRFHYNWRWFWEYGTGELGNWGVHMLDIARWGLGVELPTKIAAAGGKFYFDDDQETPDTLTVTYTYPQASLVWEHRLWTNHGIEGRSAAAAFYGEKGTLIVDRGGWKVYDQGEGPTSGSSDQARTHYRNFIDCVKSRSQPTADIEIGHVSSALCHLGNIAYRLGRTVQYAPETRNFGGDVVANTLLARDYRAPWRLPEIAPNS